MWSIRARLTIWYTAVMVAVVVVGAAAVTVIQGRLGLERLDNELSRLLLTVEGVMHTEFTEGLDIEASAAEASVEVVTRDRTLLLARSDGTPLAVWGQPLPANWTPPLTGGDLLDTFQVGATRIRMTRRQVSDLGHRYTVAALVRLDELEQEHAEVLAALARGMLIALMVAAAGGWLIAHQTLRPVGELARQAGVITERDTADRLHPRNPDDELGRLAMAFNGLLTRLGTALDGQRQFMADASHELRTPVSVLRTAAQVTLRGSHRTEQEYRESLTIVAEQAARLTRLVDAMFLLSRAEAKGMPLQREPLYLDDLTAECARACRVVADERGVDVRVTGDIEAALTGDAGLLRQMIGNLLDNAIRHAQAGGSVTAMVRRNGATCVLHVRDEGSGIEMADRERIFLRFVRLDPRSEGAGLGLPIARRIAEAHGGSLVLESSGPDGTSFKVTVPAS